ncbi:MAG: ATP-binding protein [Sedimentisphaerales bacterium]|nr:ATP-binding protein [Sedimentisphaerales bacterium]
MDDLLKNYEQEAQIRMGRMPNELTEENIRAAIDALKKFIEENKLKQNKVADMLGVSGTKLNQFLQNKYPAKKGIYELVNKSTFLIEDYEQRKKIRQTDYVETHVAKQILAMITRTKALSGGEGKIGLIIGDGGHGKSICLQQFSNANLNTIYIELDDTKRSKGIFAAIAKALHVNNEGSLESIITRIEAVLEGIHTVIILDEAAGLRVRELNQLRQVIVIKCHCPLILAGNKGLLDTIMMQPTTKRGCESLDQITSRLSYILNLDEEAGNKGDGGLYTAEDIRKLYEYGGIRLTSSAVNLLKKICMSPRSGRLRTCDNLIKALHTEKGVKSRQLIDAKDIIGAIEQLRLPVRVWLPIATFEDAETEESKQAAKAAG